MSNDFKLVDILLPYQKQFVRANGKRKKLWLSSRQIGKSFTISFEIVRKVLEKPNSIGLCISTGARAAGELLQKIKMMAEAVKILSKGNITYVANAEAVVFSNGSRVMSLPSNPDALRGYTARVVCIDEAAFVPFVDECWQAILPTLTRTRDSEVIICSTPAGMSGFFYDLYKNADDSWYVQTTTIEDAVEAGLKIDIEELHKQVNDPEIWNQEYCCNFSSSYGAFLDTTLLDWYDQIPSGNSGYYFGMDIGRKHDRTAISILKAVGDKAYLENIITLDKCPYKEQIDLVKKLHTKHKFTAGYIDEGGIGSAVAEQITKEVSSKLKGLQFTGSNKTPLYEAVRAKVFDHKLLFNPEFKQQIVSDFLNVHRLVSETGVVKFEAGSSNAGHSDVTSSLTLALEALRCFPMNFENPVVHVNSSALGPRRPIFARF